jgi:hypothetical protein
MLILMNGTLQRLVKRDYRVRQTMADLQLQEVDSCLRGNGEKNKTSYK